MSTDNSQNGPLVSVVVAAFNAERSIERAIDSILGQSYKNLEINIVDDGSDDRTGEVCRRFLDDSRVNYVRQENRGQANAKNAGISLASGSLIAFCDADDYWEKDKLSLQVPLFDEDQDVGVVYGLSRRINMNDEAVSTPKRKCHRGRVTKQLFRKNFISFGTAVVRKQCLDECGVFNERFRMGIDWDLWLRISTKFKFDFVSDVVYVYRVWEGQMSRDWHGRYEFAFAIMDNFASEYRDHLDVVTIRAAYAHTWASLAEYQIVNRTELSGACSNLIKSVCENPLAPKTWALLAKASFLVVTASVQGR